MRLDSQLRSCELPRTPPCATLVGNVHCPGFAEGKTEAGRKRRRRGKQSLAQGQPFSRNSNLPGSLAGAPPGPRLPWTQVLPTHNEIPKEPLEVGFPEHSSRDGRRGRRVRWSPPGTGEGPLPLQGQDLLSHPPPSVSFSEPETGAGASAVRWGCALISCYWGLKWDISSPGASVPLLPRLTMLSPGTVPQTEGMQIRCLNSLNLTCLPRIPGGNESTGDLKPGRANKSKAAALISRGSAAWHFG